MSFTHFSLFFGFYSLDSEEFFSYELIILALHIVRILQIVFFPNLPVLRRVEGEFLNF